MFNGQGGYQPQQFQQGFGNGSHHSGPPPAKRVKSNPVITRYPPPPGYRGPGPAPPQVPHQQSTWPPVGHPYGYGQPPHPGYPPAQSYPPHPGYPPAQSYPPHPGYLPAHSYPPPQQYQQSQLPPGYPPGYPPHQQPPIVLTPQTYYPPTTQQLFGPHPPAWQHPISASQSAPPQHWQLSNGYQQIQQRHKSAPYSMAKSNKVSGPLDGNGDPMPIPSADSEDDYGGECYYARHPDEVQSELSLGIIEWQAPMPAQRALPATFTEAELEALAPRKPHPPGEECISDYFVATKREEALLSVRQTEAWNEVKDDIIFREFAEVPPSIISKSLLGKYIFRTDTTWRMPAVDGSPEPELVPVPSRSRVNSDTSGGAMDIDSRQSPESPIKSEDAGEQEDVLGGLEQALQQNVTTKSRRQSRASSGTSFSSQHLSKPKPMMPIRDQSQEAILAALGVTGSPKMVYQTPGPAFGARTSRQNSVASNASSFPVPPPPPGRPHSRPQQRSHSYDPWVADGQPHRNGDNVERPQSSSSQHTAVGSDFQSSDQDATPRPNKHRVDSRKRGHDDVDDGGPVYHLQSRDDETPKQRRKQPRVDDAYSRR